MAQAIENRSDMHLPEEGWEYSEDWDHLPFLSPPLFPPSFFLSPFLPYLLSNFHFFLPLVYFPSLSFFLPFLRQMPPRLQSGTASD